jgi:hypothetical protein
VQAGRWSSESERGISNSGGHGENQTLDPSSHWQELDINRVKLNIQNSGGWTSSAVHLYTLSIELLLTETLSGDECSSQTKTSQFGEGK